VTVQSKTVFSFHFTTALLLCALVAYPWPGFDFSGQFVSRLGFDSGFLISLAPMLLVAAFALSAVFAIVAIFHNKASWQFWLQAACCIPLALLLPAY